MLKNMDKLYLEVKSSDKIIFKGYIDSFSSINESGPFDVLPYHANFFSIIKDRISIIDENNEKKEITIQEEGILRVMENKIMVFLGIKNLR
jgi:F0F1-type ATP synthase epsilon subunit